MRQNRDQKWFEKLGATERIEFAKAKMPNLLGHFLYLLELHANNTRRLFVAAVRANPAVVCRERIQRVPAQHAPV
jgi:hypothetical protein